MKNYISKSGKDFEPSDRYSFLSVEVLPELIGQEWNDVSLAYVSGINPTKIRVTEEEVTCDSQIGRVTVYVENNKIRKIYQEARVSLPDDVKNGYCLSLALKFGKDSKEFKFFNDFNTNSYCCLGDTWAKFNNDGTTEYLR